MAIVAADVHRRIPRRVAFDYRTDDPLARVSASRALSKPPRSLRFLVLKESGRNASLNELNRALVDENTVRLCRPGHYCGSTMRCVLCSLYRLPAAPAAVMVTLTYRHGHAPLADELSNIGAIMSRFTKRGDWSSFRKRHGIDGYAVITEVTHNRTGWNVHYHLVLTLKHVPAPRDVQRLQDGVTRRWCTAAAHTGHEAEEELQTYSWMRSDFSAVDMAEYVTKQNLLHPAKIPEQGRYAADLLADAHAGDADDLDLYAEYLDAAKGHAPIRAYGRLSLHHELDFDDLLRIGVLD